MSDIIFESTKGIYAEATVQVSAVRTLRSEKEGSNVDVGT